MRRCFTRMVTGVAVGAAIGLSIPPTPLASAAVSTQGATAAQPAPAAAETAALAEDLAVLKALAPLGLSRSQLSQLLPALQGSQTRIVELDARETEKLSALRAALEQARQDLLSGKGSGTRAQEQF